MITVANLRETIKILGFIEQSADTYQKSFGDLLGCSITVDFKAETIIYPSDLRVNEKETCNFSDNENFVVLECITRLLDKGYRAEHIEIEKRWTLGHDVKGGRADICVYDESGKEMLLIVECKKSDEYYRYKKVLEADGGQLFSYWQQEGHTKWLALYASDLKDGKVVYENNIINCSDDSNLILLAEKDDTIKLYKNAGTVEEKFEVWSETYNKDYCQDIIFGADTVAYQIGVKPLRKKDLRDFTPDDKIVNRFEEILRHNNVSDKENAFNRLVALFICKLVDEIGKDDDAELEFQYKKGIDTYETLQDRLQKLHQKGMNDFMKEKIFYVPNDYAENLVQQYSGQKRKAMIEELQNTIRILKFYTNNDFSFKDVHNEELFYQNGKVVVEVVQLFEKYRIVYPSKHQFLGDLFEQLLNKGFKQNEGQFFTPMPITRFIWDSLPLDNIISNAGKYTLPKIIDYACGAGHFLTEAVEAVNAALIRHNQTDLAKDNGWVEKNIYGIEKDYRLARVSKISLFMNGAGYGNIIFGDGLDNYPEKQIESGTFDILVANPPYAVKAFKAHFKPKNNSLELLKNITNDGSEIEVLFVERIAQLLKPEGIAAVILPASILSNSSSSYISARENLLENFQVHAIAQFGSKTFGATGTNTIVLFLEKYSEPPKRKELVIDSVAAIQSGKDLTDWEDKEILRQYLAKIEVTEDDYRLLLSKQKLPDHWKDHAYFGQFVKEFINSTEVKNKQKQQSFKKLSQDKQNEWLQEHFYQFVFEREQDKIKYFALIYKQRTLVVTSPAGNDEQKEFLGYDWSNRKGAEGIQIHSPGGKLYNDADRTADHTVSANIRNAFAELHTPSAELEKYLAWYRLQDMIDFSRVEFNKEIQTALKNIESVKYNYPMVKLGDNELFQISIGQRVLNSELIENGALPVYSANVKEPFGYINKELLKDFSMPSILWGIDGDWMTNYIAAEIPFYPTDHCGVIRVVSTKVLPYYVALILGIVGKRYAFSRHNRASTERIKSVSIPLPPVDIQQQIVSDCEKVDAECASASKLIAVLDTKIANIYDSIKDAHFVELNKYVLFNISKSEVYDIADDTLVSFVDMASVSNKGFITSSQDKNLGSIRKGGFTYFRENDIIIAKITPCMENGKCALATGLKNGIGFGSTEFHTIRCGDKILPKYLFGFLNREQIRQQAAKVMTGSSGHRRVPVSFYEQLLIPMIDKKEQQRIVDQVQKLEQQIDAAQKVLDSAFASKQAILDKYLQ
ncbi:MAG: N-6 DNA methylase [Lentisphaeria bacterium]|nr:N-6 DNA methylase [Lentisphaeria bacterium]